MTLRSILLATCGVVVFSSSLRAEDGTLQSRYLAALRATMDQHWNNFGVPEGSHCRVLISQRPGGLVNSIEFGDCALESWQRERTREEFLRMKLPYEGFEQVFHRRVSIDLCHPRAVCETTASAPVSWGAEPLKQASEGGPVDPEASRVPAGAELLKQVQEMQRLSDEIARRQKSYPQRPRRMLISTGTSQDQYRTYLNLVIDKIEKTANRHFPEEIGRRQLDGNAVVTISIARDGSLIDTTINLSSGEKLLDDAVVQFVEDASPFPPIPTADDIDILEITQTFGIRSPSRAAPATSLPVKLSSGV